MSNIFFTTLRDCEVRSQKMMAIEYGQISFLSVIDLIFKALRVPMGTPKGYHWPSLAELIKLVFQNVAYFGKLKRVGGEHWGHQFSPLQATLRSTLNKTRPWANEIYRYQKILECMVKNIQLELMRKQ